MKSAMRSIFHPTGPQTEKDQEEDLLDLRSFLSVTRITAERCIGTENTVFWVFDGTNKYGQPNQIACIKRIVPSDKHGTNWEATYMQNGCACSRRSTSSLLQAISWVLNLTA